MRDRLAEGSRMRGLDTAAPRFAATSLEAARQVVVSDIAACQIRAA